VNQIINLEGDKMSSSIELKSAQTVGKIKRFSAKYPKQSVSRAELRKAFKSWQSQQSAPTVPARKEKIKAVRFTASDIGKLRAISESPAPTAEAIVGQKMAPNQILGVLYSALTALAFTKMESEYKTRLSTAVTPTERAKVQSEWAQIVKTMQQAYAAGGLKGLTEDDLRGLSQELRKNKANFNSIVNIANTGIVVDKTSRRSLNGITVATGGFVPQTAVFIDPSDIITSIPGLCDKPFVEGSFTKHFSRSFDLTVSIPYPCGISWSGIDWCDWNFVIAGLSFGVDVQVGYRVTCCGATAWGQADAQVCGTIAGYTECATCTAKITGIAGIGQSGTGSNCTYGIGVNAELTCTLAGYTIFDVQVPFGYNVSGSCPPLGFCGEVQS
jgi:hypothetical protein